MCNSQIDAIQFNSLFPKAMRLIGDADTYVLYFTVQTVSSFGTLSRRGTQTRSIIIDIN